MEDRFCFCSSFAPAGTANVPAGLLLVVTRDSPTQVTLSLTGNATAHENAIGGKSTTYTVTINAASSGNNGSGGSGGNGGNGGSGSKLLPNEFTNRAQMAQMLYSLLIR